MQADGYGFDWLVGRVAQPLKLEPEEVLAAGKYPQNVRARSVLCYWAVRELGITTIELSRRLTLAQRPSV